MDISLAICDDENIEREYLQQLVADWAKSKNLRLKLLLYPSAEAFLFAYWDLSVDIALLDIRMGDMDGIALAKRLRQEDNRVQIVFITGLPDFIADGYEVDALHYLMKPVSNEKLTYVLDRAVKRLAIKESLVLLPLKDGIRRLSVASIRYIEVFSHDLLIHTDQSDFSVKITMSEMGKTLGLEFFRCHRSFLVNMRRVRKITKSSLEMDNGDVLPLSRKLVTKAMEAFLESH
ncbi:MAG: two component system response regulator [Herbinix sp.]|nr:two component system response regulator [Herbinix sp.]